MISSVADDCLVSDIMISTKQLWASILNAASCAYGKLHSRWLLHHKSFLTVLLFSRYVAHFVWDDWKITTPFF